MLKNYFKIAFRNLWKSPGYTLINIGGLTIGIACCLVISQYVAFEYSFDTFNKNASDLYHVTWTRMQNEGEPSIHANTGWAVGPALAQETPEIVRFTRIHPEYSATIIANSIQPDKTFEEEGVYYADPAFFQMFSYPLLSGDPGRVLAEPGTILLSQSAALKYFGNENPIGQTLNVRGWIHGEFRINGIFKDVPANSHIQFEFLLPLSDLLQRSDYNNPSSGWGWNNFITYVQLRNDADIAEVEQKFTDIYMRNRKEYFGMSNIVAQVKTQPLTDIYLNEDIQIPETVRGSNRAVYFFTLIGIITLFIAIINYINLATARALNREREVGIRKAIGAQKKHLIGQFLCESGCTILAATALGMLFSRLFIPVVNRLADTNLTNAIWTRPDFWVVFPAASVIVILLTGLYPAFILSSFKPEEILRGKIGTFAGGIGLRRALVVLQFTISIVLLSGTGIIYHQLNHMRNMDLGINLEQILTVPGPRIISEGTDRRAVIATFMQELHRLPAIHQTATSGTVPGQKFDTWTNNLRKINDAPSAEVGAAGISIDTGFVSLYGLELVAGENPANVSRSRPEGEPAPILINETAVRALGFDAPADAPGEELTHGRIAGVVKDFNWLSAHESPKSNIFFINSGNSQISVKLSTEHLSRTIASIEGIYSKLFPGNPFRYSFVDEQFDQQYKNDERFARLFTIFAALAILISCLGLLGLAAFTTVVRTKEIGIRKVLGSSVPGVVTLLSKDFIKLVLIAIVIATPIAWYAMNRWLQGFAYRIEIQWWMFVLAGLAAIVVAIFTVATQSVRAATADPVKSLRNE